MCPCAAAGAQPARGVLGVRGARRKGQLAVGFSRRPSSTLCLSYSGFDAAAG